MGSGRIGSYAWWRAGAAAWRGWRAAGDGGGTATHSSSSWCWYWCWCFLPAPKANIPTFSCNGRDQPYDSGARQDPLRRWGCVGEKEWLYLFVCAAAAAAAVTAAAAADALASTLVVTSTVVFILLCCPCNDREVLTARQRQ